MIHTSSLESDASRKIAKIEYDYNNNPIRIQFTNANVTKYVYSATGEKLRVIYQTSVYPEDADIVKIGKTKELTPEEINRTETGETSITITIADKTEEDGGGAYYVKDEFGDDMEMSMEWIVLHELIGHGIPYLETLAHKNREKCNAVENENEVRSELNETYRQEDEDHVE